MSINNTIQASVVAASVQTGGIIHFLIVLAIIIVICGLLSFGVDRSPLGAPWKSAVNWILLIIPIVYIVLFLLQFVP